MIKIGSLEFKTLSEAKKFTKKIFNKYSIGDVVSDEDREFFISGLKMRSDKGMEKIGCGVKKIIINGNKYGGKTAWVERMDGTKTDFGIYKHLEDPTTNEKDFRKACRTAIVEDKKKLKRENNLYGDVHHDRISFEDLIQKFINECKIDINKIEFGGHSEKEIEVYFVDKDLEKLWIDFHNKNSCLKVLSKENHMKEHRRIA